jgi:hypothetical protein
MIQPPGEASRPSPPRPPARPAAPPLPATSSAPGPPSQAPAPSGSPASDRPRASVIAFAAFRALYEGHYAAYAAERLGGSSLGRRAARSAFAELSGSWPGVLRSSCLAATAWACLRRHVQAQLGRPLPAADDAALLAGRLGLSRGLVTELLGDAEAGILLGHGRPHALADHSSRTV